MVTVYRLRRNAWKQNNYIAFVLIKSRFFVFSYLYYVLLQPNFILQARKYLA